MEFLKRANKMHIYTDEEEGVVGVTPEGIGHHIL